MTDSIISADPGGPTRIYSARIQHDEEIGDRGLRKWIATGKFPPPDGNLHGRNWWYPATYRRWQEDVAAGRFSQARRPPNVRHAPGGPAEQPASPETTAPRPVRRRGAQWRKR